MTNLTKAEIIVKIEESEAALFAEAKRTGDSSLLDLYVQIGDITKRMYKSKITKPELIDIAETVRQMILDATEEGKQQAAAESAVEITEDVQQLIDQGAVFYVSHSGGKDSQAMYAEISKIVPHEQIVVVHADLGEVEWTGVQEHIKANIDHKLNVVQAVDRTGQPKTFLGMVEKRGKFPSSSCRQCTSDLKRDPIAKFIRNDLANHGTDLAVNCTGIRAQESSARAKKISFAVNKRETNSKRQVFDWMPIFSMTTDEVFQSIEDAGQRPFWAYAKNERLSCVFCIMGSLNDLKHGAEQNPKLYKTYVELEKKIGHTMFMKGKQPISLEDHVGIAAS